MKFMFVQANDPADAAQWFAGVVLPDFFRKGETVTMEQARSLYRQWGSPKIGRNQEQALQIAVEKWNASAAAVN